MQVKHRNIDVQCKIIVYVSFNIHIHLHIVYF